MHTCEKSIPETASVAYVIETGYIFSLHTGYATFNKHLCSVATDYTPKAWHAKERKIQFYKHTYIEKQKISKKNVLIFMVQ